MILLKAVVKILVDEFFDISTRKCYYYIPSPLYVMKNTVQ